MIGNTSGSRGLLPQNTSAHQNTALCCLDHKPEWTERTRKARERESYWIRYLNALRPYGISRGNQSSLVRACDSLCETFCSCNFPESMRKWGPFALSIGEKHSVWRVRFMAHCILYCVYGHSGAGLGGSVGCAVRLETRRSRVQPPPRSATFFRGD